MRGVTFPLFARPFLPDGNRRILQFLPRSKVRMAACPFKKAPLPHIHRPSGWNCGKSGMGVRSPTRTGGWRTPAIRELRSGPRARTSCSRPGGRAGSAAPRRPGWGGGAAERPAAGLERRLAELAGAGTVTVGAWRGERRFFTRRGPGQEHEVLLAAGPDAAERLLVDPAAIEPSGLTPPDAWFPSPDGRRLAYLISAGGTERPALRVIDVATGELLDGPVDRVSAAPLAWLPGGGAFYYQRRPGG